MAILKPSRLPLFPLVLAREKLARSERPREVGGEPAVMDEPRGAEEYDALGTTGEVGLHHFSARAISRLVPEGGTLLDLGCGSGRLLARLAHARPDIRIIGLDLSEPMLEIGRQTLQREGLADRVELRRCDITDFQAEVPDQLDLVSCNFAFHHLPDERVAQRCLEAIAQARSATGCAVWLFDFARLRHPETWPSLASMINWPGPVVYNDAIESERASFTFEEICQMLERAGLGDLHHVRSRPIGENQAHWAPSRGAQSPTTGLWREKPLPPGTRLLARNVLLSFPHSLSRT